MIDLRSDTVTRPTAAMRHAMANAEVGDDVMGDDPTVILLQERVAELLGTEAALFMPTGTMANQIALRAHTKPGDEVIIGHDAHCWRFESGALAALAGLQTQIVGSGGVFTAFDVRAAFKPEDPYDPHTRVVAVENTHNNGGGIVWDRAELAAIPEAAHALGMVAHLDGARLWNAAVASGASEKELANGFDSVCVCLSKGLGAPMGSLVAGNKDFIKRCHRYRKMYGGGMRQVGIVAAAGLYAIEHHRARLADDHANAKAFAEALVGAKGIGVDPARVQTNIVMLDVADSAKLADAVRPDGILLSPSGTRLRIVTHLDVSREQALAAARAIAKAAA